MSIICKNCGFTIEQGSICPSCGAQAVINPEVTEENNSTQTEQNPNVEQPEQPGQNTYNGQQQYAYGAQQTMYVDDSGILSEVKLRNRNGLSAAVKTKDWLKFNCLEFLAFIPFLGSIALLVVYLVMAFGSKTAISIQNKIKADLIFSLIILGIVIAVIIVFAIIGVSLASIAASGYNNYNYR